VHGNYIGDIANNGTDKQYEHNLVRHRYHLIQLFLKRIADFIGHSNKNGRDMNPSLSNYYVAALFDSTSP